jgi:hypothetical protein
MSWHYLRELEGKSLLDICSGGDACVPLRSKITHAEFYCNGKLMDSYLDSLSGMTYAHSMAHHGQAKSMSSAVDFLAPTSVLQGEAQGLTENTAQCGTTWRGWLAKFDPDSYLWKTAQCSFIEESGESLQTFPASGMTRGGLLWEQSMSAHRIKGIERGLWRTPDTGGGGHLDNSKKARIIARTGSPSRSDWWIK